MPLPFPPVLFLFFCCCFFCSRRPSLVLMHDWRLVASLKVQIKAVLQVRITFPDRCFHNFFFSCSTQFTKPTAMANNANLFCFVFLCPLPILQEMLPNNVCKNEMISSEGYMVHRDSLAPHCPQIWIFFFFVDCPCAVNTSCE